MTDGETRSPGLDEACASAGRLLPATLFADPVLSALRTTHRHLALAAGKAVRYPAEVAPFAAVAAWTPAALKELATLVSAEEQVWVCAETVPEIAAVRCERVLPCLQMVLPATVAAPGSCDGIEELEAKDWDEMLALTDVAYPGFFRRRTPEMGRYFGIRSGGRIVAMGGERMRLPGYSELSGLCTHPEYRGRGYAAGLLGHLTQLHRGEGIVSFLHVSASNTGAIALYERLGFQTARRLDFHQLRKEA